MTVMKPPVMKDVGGSLCKRNYEFYIRLSTAIGSYCADLAEHKGKLRVTHSTRTI